MKFRIVNIIALLVLGALLMLTYSGGVRWWYWALAIWVYVSVVVWGCVSISSGFFLPVLCRAKNEDRVVALTFDDGPNSAFTPQILDVLKSHNVPATFFCIGKNIEGNEGVMKRLRDEAHLIGNHSFSHHFWFDMFGSSTMLVDMQHMNEEVKRATGLKPLLFRPPYGVINPNLKRAMENGKYLPIGWSIRSLDTMIKDKQRLLSRITDKIKGGDIILLHDSVEITATVLPELIEQITTKGFKIVPLDKMLNINAYA